MYTDADKALDEAARKLKDASKLLSMVILGEAPGSDQYKAEYKQKIRSAMNAALDANETLGREME